MKNCFKILLGIVFISNLNISVVKNVLLPGYSSNSLEDLDPKFKKKIDNLNKKMNEKGYDVRISDTFRSPERQSFIHSASQKLGKILNKDLRVTNVKYSKHNRTAKGKPASCAVDIRPVGLLTIEQKAGFYKDLRDEAVKLRLRSGANFEKRKSSPYYEFDLGYDPGHVEMYCKKQSKSA